RGRSRDRSSTPSASSVASREARPKNATALRLRQLPSPGHFWYPRAAGLPPRIAGEVTHGLDLRDSPYERLDRAGEGTGRDHRAAAFVRATSSVAAPP